jgi:signal transduction histidine kinase
MKSALVPDPQVDPRWAAQRLATVRSMAALVGHGARNRLTVVRGALELLEIGAAADLSPEQCSAFLREMDRFLEDFNLGLDMLRCQPGDHRRLSVRAALAHAVEAWQPVADRAAVQLRVSSEPGADEVPAQTGLLHQALMNLLRNATTALAGRPGAQITLRSVPGDPWLIEVADNGPGLPAIMQEGVGLTVCRDAMTLMGGTFAYALNSTGPGACFTLGFPVRVGDTP